MFKRYMMLLRDGADGRGSDGGNPDDTSGGEGDKGQAPASGELFAELETATREWVEKRHGNDIGKLATQAFELDKFAGNAVAVPKDDASPEDWGKFYSKMGRPEEAKGYELKVPENLPEGVPYDQKSADWLRETAHELGFSQKQTAGLHDKFMDFRTEAAGDIQQGIKNDVKDVVDRANSTIEAKWGAPESETFKANLELAGRAFDAMDDDGSLQADLAKVGLIGPNNEVLVPALALGLAKIGAALFQEGAIFDDGLGGGSAGNPFEGEENLTDIMVLVKADPDKARMMAKAAGKDLSRYGLK